MYKKEEYNIEFKEELTNTFLKTVSAYANYNNGEVIFGIDDNANVVGLENTAESCLKIENKINDTLNPVPIYRIDISEIDDREIIILQIFKGKYTPYYFQGKAYRRADTSTLEVDRIELNRLVMEGVNLDYEEMKAEKQDFKFTALESKLVSTIGLEQFNKDILKTLNLYNKAGYYNIAGELLADENDEANAGIDIVRFGQSINQILYRETLSNKSLLLQFDKTIEIFERYYQYEEIEGYKRIVKELIPKEAFREAVANAIVHRQWDIKRHIQISMYEDRIEINSPGGLPIGVSEDEYLNRNVSMLRNPIIASVFFRLNLIEKFGTGIARINKEYTESLTKPNFKITHNNISITLPILEFNKMNLLKDEQGIYNVFKRDIELSRPEIDVKSSFNKSKTLRTLKSLLDKNIIRKTGKGRGTKYKLK